ncbi:MAG: GerMN domain-containing protein [Treponema sp.]|nr:GerMN domain-containing protein [Treponema sp.]
MKNIFSAIYSFLTAPVKRRLFLLFIISVVAIVDFLYLGLARRTFVFYTIDGGDIIVEDRMLKHSSSREEDIIRYTEEALLGPVSPDLFPLFPGETKLKSLFYRNKTVYIDLTETAAFSPHKGSVNRKVIDNFRTFNEGILRNFSFVSDVRFFIEGNPVLLEFDEVPDYILYDLPET